MCEENKSFIVGWIIGVIIGFGGLTIYTLNTDGKSGDAIIKHNCAKYNSTTGELYWLDNNKTFGNYEDN